MESKQPSQQAVDAVVVGKMKQGRKIKSYNLCWLFLLLSMHIFSDGHWMQADQSKRT